MTSKNGIATNKKIIDLYQNMQDGTLILQPSFQRKLVWNDKHKENFLETVLLGYPFPELYFATGEIDLEKMTSKTLVVDGQQRLDTINKYIMDDKALVLRGIKRYPELSSSEKSSFLNYSVVIRDLGEIPLCEIKTIFNRINSVQYALNAMEINNALYEGEFISVAKNISNTQSFSKLDIWGESEISRMKDLELIIVIMTTAEFQGYFSSIKEVEEMIKIYENEYPNKEKMEKSFIEVLDFFNSLNLPRDSFWYRKSCIFTLISELMFLVFGSNTKLPKIENFKDMLLGLEEKVLDDKTNKKQSKYNDFYTYIYQATASRTGRNIRSAVLREEMKSCV